MEQIAAALHNAAQLNEYKVSLQVDTDIMCSAQPALRPRIFDSQEECKE